MAKVSISHKGTTCIYGILSPTGKIYIGQTWDLYHRYKSGVSKTQRLLCRSYKKYGEENHKLFIIIDFRGAFTQLDLDYWERYYIEVYKVEGYQLLNIREGGGNVGKLAKETKELISVKSRKWKAENPERVKEIVERLAKINRGKKRSDETKYLQSKSAKGKTKSKDHAVAISIAKKGKPSPHKGKHFSPDAVERIRAAIKTRNQKKCPVVQYSLEGNFIKEWPSIKDAATILDLPTGTIGGCVRKTKNYKTCGGFIWRYKSDQSPVLAQEHKQTYNPKKCPVLQLDDNDNLINEFETIKQAVETTGICKASLIMCAKGRRKSAGGFTWRYKHP